MLGQIPFSSTSSAAAEKIFHPSREKKHWIGKLNQPWWLDHAVLGEWLSYPRLADTNMLSTSAELLRVSANSIIH